VNDSPAPLFLLPPELALPLPLEPAALSLLSSFDEQAVAAQAAARAPKDASSKILFMSIFLPSKSRATHGRQKHRCAPEGGTPKTPGPRIAEATRLSDGFGSGLLQQKRVQWDGNEDDGRGERDLR